MSELTTSAKKEQLDDQLSYLDEDSIFWPFFINNDIDSKEIEKVKSLQEVSLSVQKILKWLSNQFIISFFELAHFWYFESVVTTWITVPVMGFFSCQWVLWGLQSMAKANLRHDCRHRPSYLCLFSSPPFWPLDFCYLGFFPVSIRPFLLLRSESSQNHVILCLLEEIDTWAWAKT